jgi:hypothetical protein
MNSLLRACCEPAAWRSNTVELNYPRRVAEFDNYAAAQDAVDTLVAWDFPVHHVAIVGRGLRSVERVTGPTEPRAAAIGAAFGAWFGLFGALSFDSATTAHRIGFLLSSVIFGALAGLLWAQLEHLLLRRDFSSVGQVLADRYELTVEHHLAERARELLNTVGPPTVAGTSH